MEVDEEEARAEMKTILKTFPIELELKYDEKFTSESNDEILQQVIPRLIEAMKPRVRLLYKQCGTLDKNNRRLHQNNRLNELIDLLRNILDQHAFSLQSAQLIRTRNYDDEIYNIVSRHPRGAPNWTYVEQNTPADTDFSEPETPIQTMDNLIMAEDAEVSAEMDEIERYVWHVTARIRKRCKVAEESNEEREAHLERDWKRKRRKVAKESNEKRKARLECDREKKRHKVAEETNETRLARDQKRKERQIPELYQARKDVRDKGKYISNLEKQQLAEGRIANVIDNLHQYQTNAQNQNNPPNQVNMVGIPHLYFDWNDSIPDFLVQLRLNLQNWGIDPNDNIADPPIRRDNAIGHLRVCMRGRILE
ncbi:hypothetical protein RhiirB3_393373 [Rhizophagus irregularis]|nr:hypothetical protein RhiirB3_393373 [Rhizophagus irregularis]